MIDLPPMNYPRTLDAVAQCDVPLARFTISSGTRRSGWKKKMLRRAELCLMLVGALGVAACATGGGADRIEFVEIPQNCELGDVRLVRDEADSHRLYLSQPLDAERPEPGRISCLTQWARERGFTLILPAGWPS